MPLGKKTIRDIDLAGKRVLVRVDFNVPLKDGQVADDTRIRAALPTIGYLREAGCPVVLMSHLGRPKGKPDPAFSLAPVAWELARLLGTIVGHAPDCVGPAVEAMARDLRPGQVMLLENLRFHPEEEANDPDFAASLAKLGEVYVDDAFGSAHRAHASTVGVASYLPAVAGFLMERELSALGRLLDNPARPFVVILGGAKISDKIGLVRNLLTNVMRAGDTLAVGGGMANTFLAAQGHNLGASLVETAELALARALLAEAARLGIRVILPSDLVVAKEIAAHARSRVVAPDGVATDERAVDIGPATREAIAASCRDAGTIFWNGPLGVFEIDDFAAGTTAVARAVAASPAYSVVGGGDSAAAVEKAGVAAQVSHVSTGGGASLEFLEGRTLPGVACLLDR